MSNESVVGDAPAGGRRENASRNCSPRHSSSSPNRVKMRGQKDVTDSNLDLRAGGRAGGRSDDAVNRRQQKSKKEEEKQEENKSRRQDRSSLQLDLSSSEIHMNNFRKVVASPQKPEGLKNNVFCENLSSIAKESVSNLTSKNLGYRDINKCEKRLYSEETQQKRTENESSSSDSLKKDEPIKEKPPIIPVNDEKRKLKLSLPLTEGNLTKLEKKIHRKSLISLDNKNEVSDKNKIILSPLDDIQSVKTYPSLSELNLTFSSLTAQKILQGVSVNSIDTLVEVNMLAEKRNQPPKEGVTNTDFGFV